MTQPNEAEELNLDLLEARSWRQQYRFRNLPESTNLQQGSTSESSGLKDLEQTGLHTEMSSSSTPTAVDIPKF